MPRPAGKFAVTTPNLVIIGAQKCATTSLHALLACHPDIHMSEPVKEPMYFYPFEDARKLLGKYKRTRDVPSRHHLLETFMSEGYRGERYFGDSTTGYTYDDHAERFGIAQRMSQESPECRVLYLVRNPFDRIESFFRHLRNWGRDISFREFQSSPALDVAVRTSSYAYQLASYMASLGRHRICVVGYEDFVGDQSATLARVLRFLDLESMEIKGDVHLNAGPQEGSTSHPAGFRPDVLERIHPILRRESEEFASMTGFDAGRWNLDFGYWLAE
jgi:hypothetical protein